MTTDTINLNNWQEANQRYLMTALSEVRCALERQATPAQKKTEEVENNMSQLQEIAANMSTPPALEILCNLFGLSAFERNILLMCAGMELEGSFAALCASAQGDPRKAYPTFGLALAALPEPHWSALTPDSPLRRWRLVELGNGEGVTQSPLRIDERILHYLTGISHLDERLVGLIEPVIFSTHLVPSHLQLAEKLIKAWSYSESSILPVIQLCGDEISSKRAIASAACHALRMNLYEISATAIPVNATELDTLIKLWQREAALSGSALLVDCSGLEASDAVRNNAVTRFIQRISSPAFLFASDRKFLLSTPVITFDVHKPAASEQLMVWQNALGPAAQRLNGKVEGLVSQFNLSAASIHSAVSESLAGDIDDLNNTVEELGKTLWRACLGQVRPRLEELAQRIKPASTCEDLVLPEAQRKVLQEISIHLRQRAKVYGQWGFGQKSSRGLGISALFAGASGTGKTMAAEVLANELQLDLYRIDLSQMVSKYIGETEKNLKKVFDAAEEGGAILLFDEADALFGKRSEVKDSHDRYANIEVSYLLQRMEAYRGLAILTTNMKDALDTAFLRRLRFVVQFPFPDATQRAEIWRRVFPASTPTEGLDDKKLARLNVAGGNIRNIALHGAFLAADENNPVRMEHLLRAARMEYAKLERPLTESEIGGWI